MQVFDLVVKGFSEKSFSLISSCDSSTCGPDGPLNR
jgi:hypothetical protein